jgi:hypothetical protein
MVTVDYGTGNTIGQQDRTGETGPQVAADWEPDAHCQTASGAPNNWPDGVTDAESPQSWNQTVLSALRAEFAEWADRASIPIMITETNSVSSNPGKQTLSVVNALYLEQDYLTWLENGVQNVDWWQIHNGIVTSGDNGPSLYGTASYGDYGVLSDGSCGTTAAGTQVCEPPADTPFAAYYGLQLLSRFIQPGGRLRVMVVNDDPANSYGVTLSAPGYSATAGPVLFYGSSSSHVQRLAAQPTVPPYSVTVYPLSQAG